MEVALFQVSELTGFLTSLHLLKLASILSVLICLMIWLVWPLG